MDDLLADVVGLALDDPADVFVPFEDYGFAVDVAGLEFVFDCDCLKEIQEPRL